MRSVAAVVALAACLHAGVWAFFQTTGNAPNVTKPLASVSYSPFEGKLDTDGTPIPTAAQIRADLKAIAPYTDTIRLYRSTRGMEMVPEIAAQLGLKVTLGIGLEANVDRAGGYDLVPDPDDENKPRISRNEAEIRTALKLARTYSGTVNGIVVGNETTLKRSMVEAAEANEAQALFEKQAKDYPDFASALRHVKADWDTQLLKVARKDPRVIAAEAQKGNLVTRASDLLIGRQSYDAVVNQVAEEVKADWNVDELMKIIQRVKRQSPVPVTTGETWDVWLDHPKLATAVDFVGAHILPYWDKAPAADAVDHTLKLFYKLRQAHPGKRIVIAEFGWPSGGYNRNGAEPGRIEQATVLRQFVTRADALGIEYNIIEAYDQPWKTAEGSVGRYWGVFDASRQAKFAWTGPIGNADYWKIAALAVAFGFLISLPILGGSAALRESALLAGASHVVGAWAAIVFEYWNGHYFVLGAGIAMWAGMLLLIPLVVIALARVKEIAAVLFGCAPTRLLAPTAAATESAPKVSIHIPAYMEPPEMLRQTLDAVAALDYPNFECVVVINNTPDPAFWRPVEEHCHALGARFKFVNAEKLAGYKAGALRLALAHTAPDAEIIGVIDADYAVHPDWLKEVVPAFADPKVGLIQAPQDHRDEKTPLHWAMNGEYAGFFDIGMVQRNEENAIIVHGTMCLIRRSALAAAGGWSSDTICEDTDLGLSIIEQGWTTLYTRRRYGHGLLPDTFEAYKKQRDRWAYGGLQIIRKHWRRFLPGMSQLTRDQKREFAVGWLNWLGAETIGVLVAIFNLIWVPVVAFMGIAIPDKVLTLPIMAAFAVSVAHFVMLYRRRVLISPAQMGAAMVAAMSMQWTVARAVARGLVTEHLPFVRTAKGGSVKKKRVAFPAFYEAVMGGLLILGAAIVFATNHESVREVSLFGDVLLVQSLPFLAAAALALLEETRLNSFAFWQDAKLRARAQVRALAQVRLLAPIAELVRRRAVVTIPPPAPQVENQAESA